MGAVPLMALRRGGPIHTNTMASQVLFHARRITLAGTASITGFATYKYQTDPVHVFWVSYDYYMR